MAARSRVLAVMFILVLVVAGATAALVFGIKLIAAGVPSSAILAVDLQGALPELPPQAPLQELIGERPMSFRDMREALVKAVADPRIKVVRVRVGDAQLGWATAQELHGLLGDVAAAGKDTVAYLETAGEATPGNLAYYLATGCQRIVLHPMGDVNLIGLRAQSPHIRGLLDRLEIEPDFPGIGDYKTARFFYTEKEATEASREMTRWLLESTSSQFIHGIAEARGMDDERVAALVAGGPYRAQEALDNGLVDALEDGSEFADEIENEHGRSLEEVSVDRYLRAGRPDSSGTDIAVVVAEGTIMRGRSGYSPMPVFGGDVMGSETLARAWRQVRRSGAKAVVFRVNSPGGSAMASEIIRLEMKRTADTIPVVVSMGNVAASGGYWITCGASKVIADPGTITASIGVFGGHLAMRGFWEDKLGVTWDSMSLTANADMYDSLDAWTPEQRARVVSWIGHIYDAFLDRVSEARGMTRSEVDAMARGRVFTGEQALQRGLVDALGGFDAALAEARSLAGLDPDAPVELDYYPRVPTVWQRLLDRELAVGSGNERLLRTLAEGRPVTPGPVWLPPLQLQ